MFTLAPIEETKLVTTAHQDLLVKHMPILAMDRRERFRPMRVEDFVENAVLMRGEETILENPSIEDLTAQYGPDCYLRFLSEAERKQPVSKEIAQAAQRFLTPRLGLVGLFGRIVDALFLIAGLLRPTCPNNTAVAAEQKVKDLDLQSGSTVYARVFEQGEWLVLHYAWLYAMNDWRTAYRGMNDHEGDWEQAWIFCDPADLTPQWVTASNHEYQGADLRRHWDDPELVRDGQRPVLHCAAGSHALFFSPGEYITRFDLPGLRWLVPVKQFGRWLVGSDRKPIPGIGPAVGIPFVDAAKGDGEHITEMTLTTMDDQSWCSGFRGLWGLDTGDPMQGERGPGGPKFNRRGQVRLSWADPVGFAELHGTPPPSALDTRVNRDKLDQVISNITKEIRTRARRLPLAEQTDSFTTMAQESKELSELLRQRVELEDLKTELETHPPEAPSIRGHLTAPAQALEIQAGILSSLWAMLSVPVLSITVGLAIMWERLPLFAAIFVAISVIGVTDQLIQRRYKVATRAMVLLAAGFAAVRLAAAQVLAGSWWALGAILLGAGLALGVVNGLEWFRTSIKNRHELRRK